MFAAPCIIPVPNPPPALASVDWQHRADVWQVKWATAVVAGTTVRFHDVYCRSLYAHMVARALGGR